ncbi:MAG TPA: MauE/DoxX family redox-associated membrane protein [candidate division Zixibacteria bacterium]|nr:MauE/DoxX family redox-associated membrane protein [candidate division Zixibacteria bacterium]
MNFLKNILLSKQLALLFRLFLGILFIYASVDKILHPSAFAKIIYNFHILPGFLINLFAIILPWVEFLVGMCLVLGIALEAVALLASTLLGVFIIALGVNFIRGLDINCGCFSTASASKSNVSKRLIEDVIFLAMSLQVWKCHRGFLTLKSLFYKN